MFIYAVHESFLKIKVELYLHNTHKESTNVLTSANKCDGEHRIHSIVELRLKQI